jgi:type VI protein secretion system component Hcp
MHSKVDSPLAKSINKERSMAETFSVFMKTTPEIKGNAKLTGHEDWIKCKSVGLSSTRSIGPVEARKLGAGVFGGIEIAREPDIASAALFVQHLKSKADPAELDEIQIDLCESGGEVNSSFKLTKAYIKEFRVSGDPSNQTEYLVIDGEALTVSAAGEEKTYNYGTGAPE